MEVLCLVVWRSAFYDLLWRLFIKKKAGETRATLAGNQHSSGGVINIHVEIAR